MSEAIRQYAVCEFCGKEMHPGRGCVFPFIKVVENPHPGWRSEAKPGEWVKRIRYETGLGICHDCNVTPGQLHHYGCDMERCPVCGGQAMGCDCIATEEGVVELAKAKPKGEVLSE